MEFTAKVLKGTFDEKKTTVTLEIGDSTLLGDLNKMVGKSLRLTIDDLMPIDCELSKGGFNETKATFTLQMEPAIGLLGGFSRMAENASQVDVELTCPQMTFEELAENVQTDNKRAKNRPKTEAMLTENAGEITDAVNITVTMDAEEYELFNGKRYKSLTMKERAFVDEFCLAREK